MRKTLNHCELRQRSDLSGKINYKTTRFEIHINCQVSVASYTAVIPALVSEQLWEKHETLRRAGQTNKEHNLWMCLYHDVYEWPLTTPPPLSSPWLVITTSLVGRDCLLPWSPPCRVFLVIWSLHHFLQAHQSHQSHLKSQLFKTHPNIIFCHLQQVLSIICH